MLYKTVVGNYPRPDFLREELLKIEGKQKKVDVSVKKVDDLHAKATAEVIKEFESCGIDIVTDGQLRWTDSLASFCESLSGMRMTGLIRFYDNNFYYRQPEVTGTVSWSKPSYAGDFAYAKKTAKKQVKCVLPGPYTLARLCKNSYYSGVEWLMHDLATALAMEAKALADAGCTYLQIDEPSLVFDKKLEVGVPAIREALRKVESAFAGTTMLQTYFGGFTEPLSDILDVKFDAFGFDMVEGKSNLAFLKEHPLGRDIGIGIVNSRDILMEKPKELKKTISTVMKLSNPKKAYISPNWGLELIPREYAVKKLKLLTAVVDEVKEDRA